MNRLLSLRLIRHFIKLESSGGVVLFGAAVLALLLDNSPWAHYYQTLFQMPISFSIGIFQLEKPVLLWINDGFMTIFFLLVGLEIKREILQGELNSVSKAMLPAIAALGGMIVPALIYTYATMHHLGAAKGWAIPVATDTAFALGIVSLLGKRIPVTLKIFLMALAIFDDIGAIVVMAVFYSAHISWMLLFFALLLIIVLVLFNYFRVQELSAYLIIGALLWLCVLKSGVHATFAGIILALFIPMKDIKNHQRSPLHVLEHRLHPWVAFVILPLFAFANAGVSFEGMHWYHFLEPIPLGIALGLFFGKQIGIWSATMLAVRLGMSDLPQGVTPMGLYGISLVAGVGFTMSLFIGTLAFHSIAPFGAFVRMGVILGSCVAGIVGYWILRAAYPKIN